MHVEQRHEPWTQTDRILAYLQRGETLTSLEALHLFGCFRLGARIYELRRRGHHIAGEMFRTPSGKHVARYRLEA